MKDVEELGKEKKHRSHRLLKTVCIVLASVVGLLVVVTAGALLWLTPQRLTTYFNEYLSSYLKAKVEAKEVKISLFSSFPRVSLEIDSLNVVSTTLDSITPAERASLPKNSDFLGSVDHLSGTFNVVKALKGKWEFRSVKASGIDVNLVSLNDSVNNFDIVPEDVDVKGKIPYFRVNEIDVKGVRSLSYTDIGSSTAANLAISQLMIKRDAGNDYALTCDGKMDASIKDFPIFFRTPFSMHGGIALAFNPLSVKFSDVGLMLDTYDSEVHFNVEIGRSLRLTAFSCNINSLEMRAIWRYLANRYFPELAPLANNIVLNSNISLSHPYDLSEGGVPRIDIDINSLEIKGENVDLGVSARIENVFNSPFIDAHLKGYVNLPALARYVPELEPLQLKGEALADVHAQGGFSDLNFNEVSDMMLDADLQVAQCQMTIPGGDEDMTLRGVKVKAASHQKTFGGNLAQLPVSFDVAVAAASVATPTDGVITLGNVAASGNLSGLTADGMKQAQLSVGNAGYAGRHVTVVADDLTVADGGGESQQLSVAVASADAVMKNGGKASLHDIVATGSLSQLLSGTLDGVGITASTLTYDHGNLAVKASDVDINTPASNAAKVNMGKVAVTGKGGFKANIDNLTVAGDLEKLASGRDARARLDANRITYTDKAMTISAADMALALTVDSRKGVLAVKNRALPVDLQQCDVEYTSPWLQIASTDAMRRFFNDYDLSGSLKVGDMTMAFGTFGAPVEMSDLSLRVNPREVCIDNLTVASGESSMRLSGRGSGLQRWLAGGVGEPLQFDLTLDVDTLNLNQVAHIYRNGNGTAQTCHASNAPKESTITSKTIVPHAAILVPRNLDLTLHLKADEAKYTNLDLRDMAGEITVRNGVVSVDSLSMATSFGRGVMSFCYDTADIEHMQLSANMDLQDINVTGFFEKYDNLLKMWPEMSNLSGEVGVKVEGSFLIYPYMYMNVGSLQARIDASGKDLTVRQNDFIRHVTKMMLIPYDSPIHIANIDAHANIHDNLLELYPFDVDFFKYKVQMMGINDFQGHLNYKISVLDMPILPLHFGIHVGGEYSKPILHLGGPHYDVADTRKEMKVAQDHVIDLESGFGYFMNEFVNHASAAYRPTAMSAGK